MRLAGLTMPALQIIESPGLNAYASGLREGHYVVAVTSGLVETLTDEELEAVLAHELTHIRNRDTQLMVIAVSSLASSPSSATLSSASGTSRTAGRRAPRVARGRGATVQRDGSCATRDDNRGGGRSPARRRRRRLIAIAVAMAIILITWGVSTLIRLALSRSREFLADAGAAELTKNPDALMGALRKIEVEPTLDVPSRMEAFFIENPVAGRLTGLLATHPPIAATVSRRCSRFAVHAPRRGRVRPWPGWRRWSWAHRLTRTAGEASTAVASAPSVATARTSSNGTVPSSGPDALGQTAAALLGASEA